MTFFTFLIACLNGFIFSRLFDKFKPYFKSMGLRWTYHLQAFFEVHFWQIEDIKRRDKIRNKVTIIQEVKKVDIPHSFRWEVKVKDVERKEYETVDITYLDSPK